MRYKGFFFAVIVFVLLGSGILDYRSQNNRQNPHAELSISSTKEAYIKGEIVQINIRLENTGLERVWIRGSPHPENTQTAFYVSRDGVNYEAHLNPEWGKRKIGGPMWLQPNESSEGTAYLIWNLKPNVRGMNTRAAERVQRGKILTDYTFPDAGRYFVKATLGGMRAPYNRGIPVIESEPIEITIEEPEGQDLAIWRIIQNREDIAYFMQEVDIKGTRREVRQRKAIEFQQIADRFPNTVIATQIRQKLQEYRARYPSEYSSNP